MSDNMSEMVEKLSGMLKGKEIPDNIKDMLGSVMNKNSSTNNVSDSEQNINPSDNPSDANNFDFSNIDINTIMKMQQIIKSMNSEKSSSRANLLRSLKPYLKPNRQEKVEEYIQLLNVEKVIEMMNTGGDKK